MLKYLVIPLADDSVSFCHYSKGSQPDRLISAAILKKAILWAAKENLNIQFLFPDYEIPKEHKDVINSVSHAIVASSECKDGLLRSKADIIVFDTWDAINAYPLKTGVSYVIRSKKDVFFENAKLLIKAILSKADRLVVVITDVDKFTSDDFEKYSHTLESLIPAVKDEYAKGRTVHLNLLTDRMLLEKMNNCNAGWESITLAPNGKFYICPAFYLDGSAPVGDLDNGFAISNSPLYRLDHAPLCRKCDAYQCRRCIWLNKKMTLEVNTPSHEQCVVAHLERKASQKLLSEIRLMGNFLPGKDIPQLNYLDPFELFNN